MTVIFREDITLFDPDLLASFRRSGWPPGDFRLAAALRGLARSAEELGWDAAAVKLGIRLLKFETGNWPGWGDAALILPYMSPGDREAVATATRSAAAMRSAIPVLLKATGISETLGWRPDGDGVPADVYDSVAELVDVFREQDIDVAAPALRVCSEEPYPITNSQALNYLSARNSGRTVEDSASAARIPLTALAVLERATAEAMAVMRAAAETSMTQQRYENLALGAFRDCETQNLPEYVMAIALREMMALAELPEEGRALLPGPLPWPRGLAMLAIETLGALRAHLIQADVRPDWPVEDVAPIYGHGTAEVVEEDGEDEGEVPRPLTVDDVAEMIQGTYGSPTGPRTPAPHPTAGEDPEGGEPPWPPPGPPVPFAGPVGEAVVELLDGDGNVVEALPEEAAPPPPEPRLYTGAEMARMGSAKSLENMMAVMGKAIARESVISAAGSPSAIDVQAAMAWCAVQCVDAIVRILPAQIRDGEIPPPLSRFASSVLGLLLVGELSGVGTDRIGRGSGKRTVAKFPCLTARSGGVLLPRSVNVWSLKVLERAARMGSPMLAFASDRKLAEMGEEDPGGFMGELAQLSAAARGLESPTVSSSEKFKALQRFFNNN